MENKIARSGSTSMVQKVAQDELLNLLEPQMDSDDEEEALDEFCVDSNSKCADCNSAKHVAWVSLNLGVFVCIGCSGVHRSLGSHVSKVRSVQLDTISASQVLVLKRLGNQVVNRIWEEKVELAQAAKTEVAGKMEPAQTTKAREGFILNKYVNKTFMDMSVPIILADFLKAAITDDLPKLAWFVAHDVNLEARGPSLETALHCAALAGNASACEFLLLNGAKLDVVDAAGKTPLEVGKGAAVSVLQVWTELGGGSKKVLITEAI